MSADYFAELDKSDRDADLRVVEEVTTRYHRLIANQQKRKANELRAQWGKQVLKVTLPEPTDGVWQMIAKPAPDLSILASHSFALQFTFTLAKPYISKDDNAFYIIDNPIVRDRVFRQPMVRSTSWKGNLYSALWQLGYDKQNDEQMQRLFGKIRGKEEGEEGAQAGRLFFYHTFLNQTSLEIINPHDRQRRVGKNPILFESVPIGASGVFTLLYVPFDRIEKDEQKTKEEVADDLKLVTEGIKAMLTVYGFGAKTSSGFGVAEDRLAGEGKLALRAVSGVNLAPSAAPPAPQQPDLPRYLESPTRLHADLRREDGSLRSEAEYQALIESRGQKYAKKDRQLYDKAKSWWEREGKELAQASSQEPEPDPAPLEPPPVSEYTFHTLSELPDLAQHVAEVLRKEGAS